MHTKRPSQHPSAAPNRPTQRFRNGLREALAEYESEVRRRRSIRNRPSQLAPADLNEDPADRLRARLQALVAEQENETRRQRLMRATRAKARSGHAVRRPPTGYVADRCGRWWMDPDPVVRDTIMMVFTDFERLGTIGKVLQEFRENGLRLPVRNTDLVYREPSRGRIRAILRHAAFKGEYMFGRRVTVRGQTPRRANADEIIVVPGHHEPYVTPERWEQIQAQLRRNGRSGR